MNVFEVSVSRLFRFAAIFVAAAFAERAGAAQTVTYTDGQSNFTPYNLSSIVPDSTLILTINSGLATQYGIISGSGSVEKTGAGTVEIYAANTFTGVFTLTAGTIGIGDDLAFGSSGIVINGGEIRAAGAPRTVANSLTLNSSFTVGRLTTFTGNATLGGDITITANNPADPADGDSVFSGVISGAHSIVLAEGANGIGTGAIVFGGANTYTGTTRVTSGRFRIDNSLALQNSTLIRNTGDGILSFGTLTDATLGGLSGNGSIALGGLALSVGKNNADTTFSGVISDGSLTKIGSGSLSLSNDNSYTGTTTISAGRLVLSGDNSSASYAIAAGSVLELNRSADITYTADTTFTGAGTLRKSGAGNSTWAGATATFALSSGSLIDVQAGTLTGGSFGNEVWTNNLSDLNVAAGATFGGVEANVRVDALTGAGTISTGFNGGSYANFTFGVDNGSGTFTGVLADSIGGHTGNFVKEGSGAQILGGSNTYTGTTSISGGTLSITAATGLGTTAAGTIVASGATLNLNGAAVGNEALTLSGPGVAGAGALTATGTASLDGAITLAANTTIGTATVSDSLSLNGVIGGAFALTKSGSGSLVLSSANTYSGGTNLNGGTLSLASSGALGSTGTISLGGGTLQFTAANTTDYSARFSTAASQQYRIDVNGPATAVTFASALTSAGGTLVKTGTGTLTLSNNNTFAGGITVSGGTLRATANAGALGAGTVSLAGGNLALASDSSITFARNVTVSADTTITLDRLTSGSSANTFTFSALAMGANTMTLTSGSLVTSGTSAVNFSSTTLTGDAVFSVGAGTQLSPGTIVQSGGARSVTMNGAGTLNLNSSITSYTGPTIINGGTLSVGLLANGGAVSSIGASSSDASNLVINGASMRYNVGGFAITNRLFTLGINGGSLDASGVLLSFTNPGSIVLSGSDTARTLTLTGFSTNANLLAPSLGDNGTGATSLLKTGTGTWVLGGNNTYSGPTTVSAGTLAVTTSGALPNSNLALNGGGVFAAAGTFTRPVGAGAGEVRITGASGGGFAAYGGPLNITGFTGTPTWGVTSGFVENGAPLVLGSASSDNTVTWTNSFSLGSSSRTISVNDNTLSTADTAVITGVISGDAGVGLVKSGAGTLVLNASNTYTGVTTITAGTLVPSTENSISSANLVLNGGVLGTYDGGPFASSGSFAMPLGSGSGQVSFGSGGGGFAAVGGPLTVSAFGGNPTWGAGGFITGTLVLGSVNATHAVTWTTDFSLGSSSRTISVNDNIATTADTAVISGVISGTGGINKSGSGTLLLTGANTYTGATSIQQGTLTTDTLTNVGSGAGPLGAPTTIANGTISLGLNGSATLQYTGAGATTDRVINLAGAFNSSTVEASGTGPLVFTSALTATGSGTKTFFLSGTNTGANEFQGAIANNSVTNLTNLAKSGPGTWIISGANTYTGSTSVFNGTLKLGSAGALANSALNVTANLPGAIAILDLNGRNATASALTVGGTTGSDYTSSSYLIATGGGTLTLGGNVTYNTSGNPLGSAISADLNLGSATRTFTVNDSLSASTDLVVSGNIIQNAAAGLTKFGGGTLLLSGTNTYTGGTTISGGILVAGSDSAFGTGLVTLSSGSLQGDGIARTLPNAVTVTASGLTIGGTSDLSFGGVLTNATTSASTINFTNTGATSFGGAALSASATSVSVTFNTLGGLVKLNGPVTNGGTATASSLVKTGSGILELAGGASTYGGSTTISAGTLRLGLGGSLPNTALTVQANTAGPATFDLNGQNTAVTTLTIGGVSGATSASVANVAATGGGTLTLGGDVTFSNTNSPSGSTISAALDLGASTRSFIINDSSNATIDLAATGAIGGAGGITKAGVGTLSLTGTNSYTGITTISAGTLVIDSVANVSGGNSALGAPVTATNGTLQLTGGNLKYIGSGSTTDRVLNLASSATVDSSGSGALVFTSPITSTIAGSKTLVLAGTSTAVNDFQGALVNGSGITNLTKTGGGTWRISGINTYSGSTTVLDGTLQLGSNTALPANTNVTVNSIVAGGTATLDLNGFTSAALGTITLGGATGATATSSANIVATGGGVLTLGNNVTYNNTGNPLGSTISANLNLGNATRTFTVNDSTAAVVDLTVSGNIAETASAGLTKAGLGSMLLSGTNTYTGATSITTGTLLLGSAAALPNTALTVTSSSASASAVLDLNGWDATVPSLTIGGTTGGSATSVSNIIATGGGVLTLGGNVTYSNINNPLGSTISTGLNLGNATRTFTVNDSATTAAELTVSGVIAETATAGLTKAGLGTLVLAGANTYTGVTTVSSGTLALSGFGSISTANLILNGGVYAGAGTFSRSFGTIANRVQLGSSGGGFAAYGGPLNVTGFTGTPTWGASSGFLQGNGTMILGSISADSVVTWANDFSLGVASRTIQVNDNTATDADIAVISGAISGDPGAIGITKSGTGTLVLTGENSYTGLTTISAGTLVPGNATALPIGNINLTGGVLGDTGTFSRPLGTGDNQVQFTNTGGGGFAAYGGPLSVTGFTGTPVWGVTAAFLPASAPLILGSVNATDVVTWTNSFSLGNAPRTIAVIDNLFSTADYALISGIISGTSGGGIVKTSNGLLALSGANTYDGSTTISGGILSFGSIGNVNAGASPLGAPTTAANGTINIGGTSTLRYTGAGSATDRLIVLTSANGTTSFIDASGSGPIVFNADFGNTTANNNVLGLTGISTAANEIHGALSNGSAVSGLAVSKTGPGTWILSGTNTYTGSTTVADGTLRLGSSSSLPNTALSVSSNVAGGTAILDLNGFNATVPSITIGGATGADAASVANIAGPGTLTLGGGVTFASTGNPAGSTIAANLNLGSAARTFTVNDSTNAAYDLTVSGNIGETAISGLTKSGLGTLLLTGTNTYTGGTTISTGTIVAGSNTAFGSGQINLNGGILQGDGSTRTLANAISLASSNGGIGGSSDLVFNGLLTNNTGTTSTLNISNTGATTFSGVTIGTANNAGLVINTTGGTVTINGPVSSGAFTNAGLAKSGPGTLVLGGVSTFTGQLSISQGTVRLAPGVTLPANLSLNILTSFTGADATLDLNGQNLTVSLVSLGSTSTIPTGSTNILATGGGTLTLSNSLNYNSGTGNPAASTVAANLNLGGTGRSFTVNDSSNAPVDLTITGIIADPLSASSGITKSGAGTLRLTAVNTFSGSTGLSGGTLLVDGSIAASTVTVVSGATLGGNGSTGSVTLNTGGRISPGFVNGSSSTGTLSTGTVNLSAGGIYVVEINDATGTKGGTDGWDFLSVDGAININSVPVVPLVISLRSLTPDDLAGNAANFNPYVNQSWVIATGSGGISSFAADKFVVDASGFTNFYWSESTWTISQSGNSLLLNFTAIPEPTTYAAGIAALLTLAILRRRRKVARA